MQWCGICDHEVEPDNLVKQLVTKVKRKKHIASGGSGCTQKLEVTTNRHIGIHEEKWISHEVRRDHNIQADVLEQPLRHDKESLDGHPKTHGDE